MNDKSRVNSKHIGDGEKTTNSKYLAMKHLKRLPYLAVKLLTLTEVFQKNQNIHKHFIIINYARLAGQSCTWHEVNSVWLEKTRERFSGGVVIGDGGVILRSIPLCLCEVWNSVCGTFKMTFSDCSFQVNQHSKKHLSSNYFQISMNDKSFESSQSAFSYSALKMISTWGKQFQTTSHIFSALTLYTQFWAGDT